MTESELIDLFLLEQTGELSDAQHHALADWRAANPQSQLLGETLERMTRTLPEPDGAALSEISRERILNAARTQADPASGASHSGIPWGRVALLAVAAALLLGLAIPLLSDGDPSDPEPIELAASEVPSVDTILELLSEPYSSFDDGLGQLDTAVAQVAFAEDDPLATLNTESSDEELDQLIQQYLMGEG